MKQIEPLHARYIWLTSPLRLAKTRLVVRFSSYLDLLNKANCTIGIALLVHHYSDQYTLLGLSIFCNKVGGNLELS